MSPLRVSTTHNSRLWRNWVVAAQTAGCQLRRSGAGTSHVSQPGGCIMRTSDKWTLLFVVIVIMDKFPQLSVDPKLLKESTFSGAEPTSVTDRFSASSISSVLFARVNLYPASSRLRMEVILQLLVKWSGGHIADPTWLRRMQMPLGFVISWKWRLLPWQGFYRLFDWCATVNVFIFQSWISYLVAQPSSDARV